MRNRKGQISNLGNSVFLIVIAVVFFVLGMVMIQALVDSDVTEDEKTYTLQSNLTDPVDFTFVADSEDCPLEVQVTNSLGSVMTPSFVCGTDIVTTDLVNITNGNNEVKLRYTV